MAATSSAQDMVRPGECVDLYYYDGETSKKQCFPVTLNTKYIQNMNNLSSGSSTFTIPPNNGVQDIVMVFKINTLSATDASGLALPAGWGYYLLNQVSFRYGGSSQYFLSGDQILQNALRKQTNRVSVNDILNLGGAPATSAALQAGPQFAAIVLTLPHSTPSGVGKAHPLPSDALTQQIQVTAEIRSVSDLFAVNDRGGAGAIKNSLDVGYFQVQQVLFNNAGDALARRVDMAENAYAFPAEFVQQKQVIPLANTATSQSIVLTGFRSGEVKSIQCWLTKGSDVSATAKNPWNWYQPIFIQMTYAGDIYARFDNNSAALWNLINSNKSNAFDTSAMTYAGPDYTFSPGVSVWTELPFAQTLVDEDSHYTLVHGKPITNGIVNLDIQTPFADADWVLNVSYIYNTTLLFSQGTVDYVF
jgi:hypothetical protein